MTGNPQNAVASRDGRWLLTVYSNPDKRYAFVHALDLRTGIAHCIDLPNAYDAAGSYALALSRSERTLYVADAAAGFVQTISLRKLRVTHVIRFPRAGGGGRANAAASPDGRSLAFTTGSNVWILRNGVVGGPRALPRNADGIAFTPDGRHVVALMGRRFVTVP
jgi:DNA-binding beta-propeller fold protein YncE